MAMKPILIFLGIILMFIGFFMITLGMILPNTVAKENHEEQKTEESSVKYSGVVMIGPIPIVFGNSPTLMIISILIAILMIVWMFLFVIGLRIK
jgi:uncharacterized protein (TIGR00304 family)